MIRKILIRRNQTNVFPAFVFRSLSFAVYFVFACRSVMLLSLLLALLLNLYYSYLFTNITRARKKMDADNLEDGCLGNAGICVLPVSIDSKNEVQFIVDMKALQPQLHLGQYVSTQQFSIPKLKGNFAMNDCRWKLRIYPLGLANDKDPSFAVRLVLDECSNPEFAPTALGVKLKVEATSPPRMYSYNNDISETKLKSVDLINKSDRWIAFDFPLHLVQSQKQLEITLAAVPKMQLLRYIMKT